MKAVFTSGKSSVFFLFFLFAYPAFAAPKHPFLSYETKGYSRLFSVGRNVYLITDKAIYNEEKNKLMQLATMPVFCNSAAASGDEIWLATKEGIQVFDTKRNSFSTALPDKIKGNITHIEADEQHAIWFTKEWEGCFKINNNQQVLQIVKVPVTYSMVHTSDSNIWVGTNVGLYKVPVSGKEIVRYAEEGIADNDLPDNLVEQLHATGNSVWAVMPGHLTHIVPDEEESPDFENIGQKDNELYNIVQMPTQVPSFLFVTKQGILYLPKADDDGRFHTGEIHQEIKERAYLLSNKAIDKPADAGNETVNTVQLIGNKAYFLTAKGYWSIAVSNLLKQLKQN